MYYEDLESSKRFCPLWFIWEVQRSFPYKIMKEVMDMAIFKGAGVAIITPFTKDNQVNYDKLEELINFQAVSYTHL